jgi:hypothetical protein
VLKEENHHPKTPKNTHTRKNKLWTDQNKKLIMGTSVHTWLDCLDSSGEKQESESFDDEDLNAYRIADSNSSINEIEHTRDRRSGVWIC